MTSPWSDNVGSMSEIIFEVREDATVGGYTASALGYGIHTQADTLDELRSMVKEAVDRADGWRIAPAKRQSHNPCQGWGIWPPSRFPIIVKWPRERYGVRRYGRVTSPACGESGRADRGLIRASGLTPKHSTGDGGHYPILLFATLFWTGVHTRHFTVPKRLKI